MNEKACADLQPGSGSQVGADAVLSGAAIAGFGVEEAVQQPGGVQHVNHEHPEQQLRHGAPLSAAAVRGGGLTRREHGSCRCRGSAART